MAKTMDQYKQEEMLTRAQALRQDVDREIARQEFAAKREHVITQEMIEGAQKVTYPKVDQFQRALDDALTTGTGAVQISAINPGPLVKSITESEWLDKTQSMRVVALNEALGYAKALVEHRSAIAIDVADILETADRFAKFLVSNKR